MPRGIPKSGINRGWFKKEPRPERRTGIVKVCPCGKEIYCEARKTERKKYCSRRCLGRYKIQPPRTVEWRYKIGLGHRGKDYSGTNRGHHVYSRDSWSYKKWREYILKRDRYCCVFCGNKEVQVHHILRWADHAHLRFDVSNGISLCKKHHPRKKSEEIRHSRMFSYLVYK